MATTDPTRRVVENLFALQRLGNSLSRKGRRLIREMFDEIVGELAKIDPTDPGAQRWRRHRLQKLLAAIGPIIRENTEEWRKLIRQDLAEVGAQQASHARAVLVDSLGGAAAMGGHRISLGDPSGLGINFFKSIIDTDPFQGDTLAEWATRQERRTLIDARRQLRMGMAQNEGIPELTRRLRDIVEPKTARGAEAITRTAVNEVATTAHMETYQKNADITTMYTYVATLDLRTSEICRALDGQTYRYDDPNGQRPPQHFNCRSSIVPEVDWEALGLTPPEEGLRASKDGPVAASTNYEQWLREQSEADQNEVLGPARAKLFREGKVTLDQMVREDGGLVTLEELAGATPKPEWQEWLHQTVDEPNFAERSMQGGGGATIRRMRDEFQEMAAGNPEAEAFYGGVQRWIVGGQQAGVRGSIERALDGEDDAVGKAMLRALRRESPDAPTLFRGEWRGDAREAILGRYAPDTVFDLRMSSFTADRGTAERFATWGEGQVEDPVEVIFTLRSGSRAVPIENLSFHWHERERYTGGRFRVLETTERAGRIEILLEQLGVFDL